MIQLIIGVFLVGAVVVTGVFAMEARNPTLPELAACFLFWPFVIVLTAIRGAMSLIDRDLSEDVDFDDN